MKKRRFCAKINMLGMFRAIKRCDLHSKGPATFDGGVHFALFYQVVWNNSYKVQNMGYCK